MLLVKARVGLSNIQGLGLFAKQFIPLGTTTWRFTAGFDLEIPVTSLDLLSPVAREQVLHYAEFFATKQKFVLSSDDDRFTNHSDNPNTVPYGDTMVAVRDINEDEEITCDYRQVVMVGLSPNSKS